jgi:DNA-binding transcriptional ArsR family regulator
MRIQLPKFPAVSELELTDVLYALSDPTRLDIVRQLAQVESLSCGCFKIDMPKSSLSHHFRILRASGVVMTQRKGTTLFNELRRADLEQRFPGLLRAVLGESDFQKSENEGVNRKTNNPVRAHTGRRRLSRER